MGSPDASTTLGLTRGFRSTNSLRLVLWAKEPMCSSPKKRVHSCSSRNRNAAWASEERHLGNDPAKQALKTSLETDKGIGQRDVPQGKVKVKVFFPFWEGHQERKHTLGLPGAATSPPHTEAGAEWLLVVWLNLHPPGSGAAAERG